MKSMDNYQRPFFDGEKQVIHTWKNPFPKMHYSNDNDKNKMDKMKVIMIDRKKEMIVENLTCYFFRENFIDNSEILLGYPIVQSRSVYGKDKIELYPIPQLLTYEAFQMQTSNSQSNNNNNNNYMFGSLMDFQPKIKAANNQYFNNWLPIYVNEAHFLKNLDTIKTAIKTIKNEVEFHPEQIFDILPIILNKMIIGIFNGKSIVSTSYITCYFHYVLLFKRLCREYQEEFNTYVNKRINLITMNDYEVNKKIVPDIGDFFMLIFLSNKDMSSPEMIKIKNVLIEEFLIRQIYWIFHGPDCQSIMREKVIALNNVTRLNDDVYLEKFHNDPDFKMRYLDIFNKELHNKNIFHKVINTIANDKNFLWNYNNNFNYAKRSAENRITQSFKKLYNECSDWGRNRLNNIIKENMRFGDFFIEDEKDIRTGLYYACQVDQINQLLLITFLVLNKLGEQGFMDELEKNYGIYLEVDAFFLDMKKKLKDIKSYKELYEFIKVDLGKDKTELEIIIDAYEKAKKKRYIRDPNESLRNHNNYQVPQYQYDYQNNYGNHYRYNNRYNRGRRW